jgi:hypothetical protein
LLREETSPVHANDLLPVQIGDLEIALQNQSESKKCDTPDQRESGPLEIGEDQLVTAVHQECSSEAGKDG